MADKYWIVEHEVFPERYARYSSVARPGLATTHDDPVSKFDKMIEDISQDAEATSGVRPLFVNFVAVHHDMGEVLLRWCLFEERAALAFSMLVSGKITEYDWASVVRDLSKEELLVKFFEEVIVKSW
jgi:hypothetical protein